MTVTGSADVIEVVAGPTGLLRADHRPSVIVNCSTVSEEASAQARAAAEKYGVDFLAAPISGNPAHGGQRHGRHRRVGIGIGVRVIAFVLDLIAPTVIYAGTGDTAMLVKLCSIVLMGTFTTSLYELAALARKGGVPGFGIPRLHQCLADRIDLQRLQGTSVHPGRDKIAAAPPEADGARLRHVPERRTRSRSSGPAERGRRAWSTKAGRAGHPRNQIAARTA